MSRKPWIVCVIATLILYVAGAFLCTESSALGGLIIVVCFFVSSKLLTHRPHRTRKPYGPTWR